MGAQKGFDGTNFVNQLKALNELKRRSCQIENRAPSKAECAIRQLQGGNSNQKFGAIKELMTMDVNDSKQAVPALIKALKNSAGLVRSTAALALAKIGDDSAISALLEVLEDKDICVRAFFMESLKNLVNAHPDIPESKKAIGALIRCSRRYERELVMGMEHELLKKMAQN